MLNILSNFKSLKGCCAWNVAASNSFGVGQELAVIFSRVPFNGVLPSIMYNMVIYYKSGATCFFITSKIRTDAIQRKNRRARPSILALQ